MIKPAELIFLISVLLTKNVAGQFLNDAEKDFLDSYAVNVHLDSSYGNGSWDAILDELSGKNLILIGEFDHESREVCQARNSLIKTLHEEGGFDVILFEAGIGEMGVIDLYRDSLTASQMTLGLFGGWRTTSFQSLMDYIKVHKISIGGFDVQRTNSGLVSRHTWKHLHSIGLESDIITRLEQRFSKIVQKLRNRQSDYDSIFPVTEDLIHAYLDLNDKLAQISNPLDDLSILKRTIHNRISFLRYYSTFINDQDWQKRWEARDFAMAENVEWLKTQIFPDRKIIVVGHNFHISKYNQKEEVMGEFLDRKYPDDLYVLGFFAGAGSHTGSDGKVKHLSSPDSNGLDIKHIIHALDGRSFFIPMPKSNQVGPEWCHEPITINDTFIDLSGSNQLRLSKNFDGLLLLDSVSSSIKLW